MFTSPWLNRIVIALGTPMAAFGVLGLAESVLGTNTAFSDRLGVTITMALFLGLGLRMVIGGVRNLRVIREGREDEWAPGFWQPTGERSQHERGEE